MIVILIHYYYMLFVLLSFNCILLISSQQFIVNNNNGFVSSCSMKQTCSECIREKDCVWCSKPDKSLTDNSSNNIPLIRCINKQLLTSAWCPDIYIYNPAPSQKTIERDEPFRPGTQNIPSIQIRPQKVHLTLRLGEEYNLNFQYSQAEDYPVDLYYLMDLSASMADDRDNLKHLGDRLATTMRSITKNFRLGFGSFVDKTDMPYISIVPEKLERPCTLESGEACVRPYSFHNHLSLTEQTELFTKKVQEAPISGNLDASEGGFDAILQAIVCQKEIGWRPNARHLLVFSTDAGFHLAGDGKLAGIVIPHDGQCYLDNEGYYTQALKFDYPSISLINRYVKKHNINLIFAVTKNQEDTYRELKQNIRDAEYGILNKDSSNVVELVRGVYDKLADTLTITDNANSLVEIKYFSTCGENSGVAKETHKCEGVRYGKVIDFTASIKVVECPDDRKKWHHTFEIRPSSINESVLVDIDVICDCPCEKHGNVGFEENSSVCKQNGNLQCGICSCNSGKFGRFCECDGDSTGLSSMDSGCKATNETKDLCSGHGACKCGKCECDKRLNTNEYYYGTFCECNNFSCKYHGGILCAGHGNCDCGVCKCHSGWNGTACDCEDTVDNCIKTGTNDICSGKGHCECGSCICQTEPYKYSGKYCEQCLTCPGQHCNEIKDCVECQAFNSTGNYNAEECRVRCTSFNSVIVDKIEIDDLDLERNKICSVPDNSGCSIIFKYTYDKINGIQKVYVQKDKDCATQVNLIAVLSSLIGTIVLAGIILLLIWKLLTEMHDRREYVRFERERQMAKWNRGENPLYKPSISTFNNPTFGQME